MLTYEPDYSPDTSKQILVIFAVILISLLAIFFYQFFKTYKNELNQAVFYGLAFIGVLILIVATYSAFYVLAMLRLNYQEKKLYAEKKRQQLQKISVNNELVIATTEQIRAGTIYLSEQKTEQGSVKFESLQKIAKPPPVELLSLPEPEAKNSLLADIAQAQRLLIVGGQNSGKTTLLKHIAKQRSCAGSVWVLDSHNTLGKWSSAYKIVGHGRDYSAIESALKNLVGVMDSRYRELASGKVKEREHELITVISDEWTTVSKNLNNLDAYLLPLLTESRKVGIDLILATHSQTAESLGLKGKADLKTAFDAVLFLKNINGKRLIELDNGETLLTYQHCGQFHDEFVKDDFACQLKTILNNPMPEVQKEQQIIEQFHALKAQNNFSWNQLAIAVYGRRGGHYIDQLKSVLIANNIGF